jgi:uncharacterized protein (TIGR00375 family)
VGTSDFTHPAWFSEIKSRLEPAEEGLFKLKAKPHSTRFMLTTEIACIYSKGGKTRRLHHVVLVPSIEAAERINKKLSWIGNLKADGRPMLGLDSRKLLEIVLDVDQRSILIPAHAWTPWFSIFGSMSGFDSIEECFEDMSSHIFAIETGLSSDPPMNWRLSSLDKISLVSNSDAHSPAKLGREANVFDCPMSYDGMVEAIKSRDPQKFLYTIEFFPEEGKYHFDGHRNCEVSFSPTETKKHNGVCPKCGRHLTVGVLSRVEELADRSMQRSMADKIPYKNLVPLNEIIAEAKNLGSQTKTVWLAYAKLLGKFGSELTVLLETPIKEISDLMDNRIAEGIKRMREGNVKIQAGYDGEYGKISIFGEGEQVTDSQKQESLF